MAAFTTAAIVGTSLALSAAGTYMQYSASKEQSEAQKASIAAEQRAEELRRRQMMLEARRRSTEILRNQQRARATALATATAQNAGQGSGVQGGFGQISGQAGTQYTATAENLAIGRGLFDANMDVSSARMAYAGAGTEMAFGRGLSSLGSTLMSVTPQLTSMAGGYNPGGSMVWGGGNTNPYMSSNSHLWYK